MRRRWVVGLVLCLAGVLLAGRLIAGWVVDVRWYQALGAAPLFWARATNLLILRGTAFAVGTAFALLNLYAVRHSVASVVFPRKVGNIEIGEELPGRYLALTVLIASVAVGSLLAILPGDWISLELTRHGETFRESDPHFQLDLAFWVYWLPLEEALHAWSLIAAISVSLIVACLYALTPSLRWERDRLLVTGHVRRHMCSLGGLLLLLLAWSYRLDAFRLLLEGSGSNGAFSALDHRVGIPANLVLALSTVVGAMLLVWSGWAGQVRLAIFTLAAVLVLSLGLRQLLPAVASRWLSPPDGELRERPYLATRAAFSRRAFDLDRVTTAGRTDRTGSLSEIALGTPMWDTDAITRAVAFSRLSGRARGALGWEWRENRLQALVVEQPIGPEAAEILAAWNITRLDPGRTGDNGALMRPTATEDGIQRIPAVLVGDSVSGYALTYDSSGTVAAPALRSWRDRLAHAWGLQNPRLLRRGPAGPAGPVLRVVQHRDVRERLRRLYPVFMQGNRVAPILVGDSLTWAVHLYASSETYPLADPVVVGRGEARYFRHAGVALINAATGRTTAIATASPDPLTASWMQRFPNQFVPLSAMREDLLRQLPPPVDVVLGQARVLARFGRRGEAGPASYVARLTGSDTLFSFPTFAPFADSATQRLAVAYPILDAAERLRGAIVATGGADVAVRWVALDSLGPRWQGTLELLRRALDSAATGNRSETIPLVRGPARIVAAGRRLVVVQTAYLWQAENAPTVRFSAATFGDSARVGRTLLAALGVPEPAASLLPLTPEAFRARVTQLYRQMREATTRGDFAAFGEAFTALGQLLRANAAVP